MPEPNYNYDEVGDTLYISFAPGEHATGILLTDHILLRVNKQERRAVGITLLNYSYLSQQTEFGPRQFPLTGLAKLSPDLCELALDLLVNPPVSDTLALSAYTRRNHAVVPIVTVHPIDARAAAA